MCAEKRKKRRETLPLLRRLRANPTQTRREVREKLRFPEELNALAAEHFALVVYLCDDLLQLQQARSTTTTTTAAAAIRFYKVARRLPM